jgi:cold shock CspA family protein
MKQRILLPALVLGVLFAAALSFLRTLLPEATPVVAFAVDAVVLVVALFVYGQLMRAALDAAPSAPAAGKGRDGARESRGRGGRGGRGGNRKGGERGERSSRDADRRGREAPSAPAGPREEGHIKWFSGAKGYGFIIRPDGEEIFVHHRSLRDKSRRELPDGQPVSYVIVDRDKGPQADDVELRDGEPAERAA